MSKRKAVVAMSGGVDSSVAAALMVDAGFDVTGVMLKLWDGEAANNDSGCCNVGAADDARRVADVLGIPFYVLNLAERFEATVVADFKATYAAGRTPNPCVRCNQWVKFGMLRERADALGANVLATGHYARIATSEGRSRLLRGVDSAKDQSYVLWMLGRRDLARTRFPVGEMTKPETRAVATGLGLRTAAKPDSQEICFVRGGDLPAYVADHIPAANAPGPILDTSGDVIGRHAGIGRYTVGQRRGLGISLGYPVFVTSIDADANALVVGDMSNLAVGGLEVAEASFVEGPPPPEATVFLQHRAHGDVVPATVAAAGSGGFSLRLDEPAYGVAPGQSAVLYAASEPDEVIGGGIVAATVPAAVAVG